MKNKTINWQILTKKGENYENLLVSIVGQGWVVLNSQKNKPFGPFYTKYYRQIDGHRDSRKEDIERCINDGKKQEKKKPGSILKSYYDYEKVTKGIIEFADSLERKKISQMSNQELIGILDQYSKKAGYGGIYTYNNYFYQYLADELYQALQTKVKNLKKQAEIFETLTQATRLSVIQNEKKDILKLVKKIDTEELDIKAKEISRAVDQHLEEYGFMGFYFLKGQLWGKEYIEKKIKDLLRGDYQQKLQKLVKAEKNNQKWQSIAQKIGLNKSEIILAKTLKQMAYCTNLFDENWNYLGSKSQVFLNELAKRLKISYRQLIEMGIEEIKKYLRNNQIPDAGFQERMDSRIKDGAYILEDGVERIIEGQELKDYKKEQAEQEKTKVKTDQLKGQPSSTGKTKGKVVLVYGVGDLDKVKKGDILVAKNTVPSFVPAMERSAGIVVEVGGLLSHAAIVSRELGIPCVVGVNDAMKILKDGDMIEVDAKKGIVKIIENAK